MAVMEILFRGKTNSVEWVYGYFVELTDYIDESKKRSMIIPVGSTIYPRCEIASPIEVIADTVGQWTGLVDKNGAKIFGGDIVKCSILYDVGCYPHMEIETRVVTYKDGRFNPLYYCERNNVEVIGNIWDNPELVKSVSE